MCVPWRFIIPTQSRPLSVTGNLPQAAIDLSRSQRTQKVQEELDDVKTSFIDQKANMLGKLEKALSDVRSLKDTNRALSQTIRDMETEREGVDKPRKNLLGDVKPLRETWRATQEHKEVVAHKERLEKENYTALQQLSGAKEREKGNLQLIQDLEQEIRLDITESSRTASVT